jgi:hypothetical protein
VNTYADGKVCWAGGDEAASIILQERPRVAMRPSRRDAVKVAQYEVLGSRFLEVIRPGRDDRCCVRS